MPDDDHRPGGLSPELRAQIHAERQWWWTPHPRLFLALGLLGIVTALLGFADDGRSRPWLIVQLAVTIGMAVSAALTLRSTGASARRS